MDNVDNNNGSVGVEIKVEIHPRTDHWLVAGRVQIEEVDKYRSKRGTARQIFLIAEQFPTKQDAEAYVRRSASNWIQGVR